MNWKIPKSVSLLLRGREGAKSLTNVGQVGAPGTPQEVGQGTLRYEKHNGTNSDYRLHVPSSAKKTILSLGRSPVLKVQCQVCLPTLVRWRRHPGLFLSYDPREVDGRDSKGPSIAINSPTMRVF